MKTRNFIAVLFITLVFMTACGAQPDSTVKPQTTDALLKPLEKNDPAPVITETSPVPATEEIPTLVETSVTDCLGGEISPIGQSIADDYESTSYEQVMTWFCKGAEFEDILVALETEAHTDTSADEMLKMLADGFTWDEIWQLIGLTE